MMSKWWTWLLVCAMVFGGCLALAESDEPPVLTAQPQDGQHEMPETWPGEEILAGGGFDAPDRPADVPEPTPEDIVAIPVPIPEPVPEPEFEPGIEPEMGLETEAALEAGPQLDREHIQENELACVEELAAVESLPEDGLMDSIEELPGQPDEVQPDLAQALSFWQDTEVELCYLRDAQSGIWVAQPLPEPVMAGVYVTNTAGCTLGPIDIVPDAHSASDEGGRFSLSVGMEPAASGLSLGPGESARIATFTFTGQGGESDAADAQQLSIGFCARYSG